MNEFVGSIWNWIGSLNIREIVGTVKRSKAVWLKNGNAKVLVGCIELKLDEE